MTYTYASIPVELKSPGQVLACMGFLEAAEVLLGSVEAHFNWTDTQATFNLRAGGHRNPFEVVLEFLSLARIVELTPIGYVEGGAADDDGGPDNTISGNSEAGVESSRDEEFEISGREETESYPTGEHDRNSLPLKLVYNGNSLAISHWADGSSRDPFKLYSGNRSAKRIATQMLQGVRAKPKKNETLGALVNKGLLQLWQEQQENILLSPFEKDTPMGGSFNFDPRGAWTAIDAGYSPNTQKDGIAASPVVEILAAIGLEHSRPYQYETRKVRYAVWGQSLPPMLARAALAGAELKVPMRRFHFELDLSGKNKVTTFAQEENKQ